ncbi:LOW QUALITY PROTEIN: MACPF domain-containing protein [Populus alba x Populus x berolinensis]|uniref:MACPF domain-containing protein n=1 Tax=Populus alba x Populus x berolinensis TaxID=444605 RepID=A0AAD6L6N3_9ROSI|nr:LOW QUALITY PROTEIN: MACPF domain-containing protein [Populus alba x Populus x berolinensis]
MRSAKKAAEEAIEAIGLGYDLGFDLRLKYCKKNSPRLIVINDDGKQVHNMVIPGGFSIPNVPKSIKCDKGERLRFSSDVLSFQQMSEQFNQELSLSGKIPSGHFNSAFEFSGVWQKDAANTKALAFDGVNITLYSIALDKSQVVLCDHVKEAVPSSWEPAALASFIEKYGTHVIVGIKMGGKDMICMKQQHSSPLPPVDVQKKLKDMADKMFVDGGSTMNSDKFYDREKVLQLQGLPFMDQLPSSSYSQTEHIKFISKRKGGNKNLPHKDWCQTVQTEPDVISMSFVPITSLLSGINGSGFLTHAINLYIHKPPLDELHQFLEFQLPRQWAPVFGELALGPDRKQQSNASLQFSLMGPKLYVNTTPVDVGKKPVTGLRLTYLHCRKTFQLADERGGNISDFSSDHRYYEKVKWKSFSHICTAPVESEDDLSIVTGAQFEVGESGLKKVLFLRLQFSRVIGTTTLRRSEWDGFPCLEPEIWNNVHIDQYSFSQKQPPPQPVVNINSAVYPGGPPVAAQTPKLLKFVDTTEMTRGPQDAPGYWAVSGAKLNVDKGKISLRVKYSLLPLVLPDDDVSIEM